MLSNCGIAEDSLESPGLQGDQTSQFWRKSILNIHWKDWCWSWSCNTWATWYKELNMTEWLNNNIYSSKDITGKLYLPPFNPLRIRPIILKEVKSESEVTQLCPTLCHPMDYSLTGSSIHGIFQARVLEWVAISFPRGSSQPRDWIRVSHIVGRCFTIWAIREVPRSICELTENFYSEILQTWVEINSPT